MGRSRQRFHCAPCEFPAGRGDHPRAPAASRCQIQDSQVLHVPERTSPQRYRKDSTPATAGGSPTNEEPCMMTASPNAQTTTSQRPLGRYFEEFQVGETLVSGRRTITQKVTIKNQRDETVIEGQQTVMLQRRPVSASR